MASQKLWFHQYMYWLRKLRTTCIVFKRFLFLFLNFRQLTQHVLIFWRSISFWDSFWLVYWCQKNKIWEDKLKIFISDGDKLTWLSSVIHCINYVFEIDVDWGPMRYVFQPLTTGFSNFHDLVAWRTDVWHNLRVFFVFVLHNKLIDCFLFCSNYFTLYFASLKLTHVRNTFFAVFHLCKFKIKINKFFFSFKNLIASEKFYWWGYE